MNCEAYVKWKCAREIRENVERPENEGFVSGKPVKLGRRPIVVLD